MSTAPRSVNRFDDDREVGRFELEPGNSIRGTLLEVEERSSSLGGTYKYLIIEDEQSGKLLGVPAWHHALRERLAALRPKIGERILIRVGEKVKLDRGTYQKYVVRVDRETAGEVDWDDETLAGTENVMGFEKREQRGKSMPSPFNPDEDDRSDLPF